jgi:hypothetical protein
MQDSNRIAGSECPDIAGRYARTGEEYWVLIDGGKREVRRGSTFGFVIFLHPDRQRPGVRVTRPLSEKDRKNFGAFWITHSLPDQYEVNRVSQDELNVETMIFEKSAGDFSCSDGMIQLRTITSEGAGETDLPPSLVPAHG